MEGEKRGKTRKDYKEKMVVRQDEVSGGRKKIQKRRERMKGRRRWQRKRGSIAWQSE